MEDPQPAANPDSLGAVPDLQSTAEVPHTQQPGSNRVPDTASAARAPPLEPNLHQTPPPDDSSTPQEPPSESRKRPLDTSSVRFLNLKSYKMRLIIKDLRPHFIEVLQTPDFQNCKAANEIKEQMKLLIELYNQMAAEIVEKQKDMLDGETGIRQVPQEQPQVQASENKISQSGSASEKHLQPEDKDTLGSYIVGGSAFGWNFITFSGNVPVYYGVTKESFRNAQAKVQP